MHLLVIEDDPKISAFVVEGFAREGHTSEAVSDGRTADELWKSKTFDAVILDRMLPGLDGMKVLKRARSRGDDTPVIVLSAMGAVGDRVFGIDGGADDYLCKPFCFSELSARVRALVRRKENVKDPTVVAKAGVRLNLLKRTCSRDRKRIELQPREFALLELLMRNAGHPQSKAIILEKIWGWTFDPQTNVVDVLICKLRAKIDAGYEKKLIINRRGVGYLFQEQE